MSFCAFLLLTLFHSYERIEFKEKNYFKIFTKLTFRSFKCSSLIEQIRCHVE